MTLYGYGILAFDRQVAGLSPTDGVWSLYQREGLLQHALQGGLLLNTVAPNYLGYRNLTNFRLVRVSHPGEALNNKW